VELSIPKAVKSAFTMTGAPAMIRPPMIDSLPASVSPRRMANPPPTTQMVPQDEADEHHDAQRLARSSSEIARSLRKNRNEVRCEKFGFHVSEVLPRT